MSKTLGCVSGYHAGKRLVPRRQPKSAPGRTWRTRLGIYHGDADIPFHVGIEGEEIAVVVEREVERIAETAGVELDFGAVGFNAEDVAGGELDVAIEHAGVPRIR